MAANPFNPSWGTRPPLLAGRDELLDEIMAGIRTGPARHGFHHILYGARGMGKTVVMHEVAHRLESEGWPVIAYTGSPRRAPTEAICEAAPTVARALAGRRAALRHVHAELEVGGGPVRGRIGIPNDSAGRSQHNELVPVLRHVGELARDRRRGVLLMIDEAQRVQADDLEAIGVALADLERFHRLPLSLLAAGLYDTPRHLAEASTFFERQDKRELRHLSRDATALALLGPMNDSGVRVEPAALARLVELSRGYPFAVQLYGWHAWEQAAGTGSVTVQHLARIQQQAGEWLAVNLFRPRWERLGPLEQAMVKALAAAPGEVIETSELARRVGRRVSQLSTARESLLHTHHLLHSPEHGKLAFDLPGFGEWVRSSQDMNRVALPPVRRAPPGRDTGRARGVER